MLERLILDVSVEINAGADWFMGLVAYPPNQIPKGLPATADEFEIAEMYSPMPFGSYQFSLKSNHSVS